MKQSIVLLLILISSLNCKQSETNIEADKIKEPPELITSNVKDSISNTQHNETSLDTLIPIKILKIKSKDIYKKYGLEFVGNCYTCDLVNFRIENNEVLISNVCDDQTKLRFEIITLLNTGNKIEIKTKGHSFIFLRVGEEPIYKLKKNTYNIQNEYLRISEYFTFKKNIMSFEVHDCGGFEG